MRAAPPCAFLPSRRRAGLVLALAALPHLTGCATTVYPPSAVAEPARVAILDHGQHSSLVMALPGNATVRYAYGDRRYFALRQTGPFEGIAALFWPTQAVLGRKRLPGPLSPGALLREIREFTEDVVFLEVDVRAARRLMERLDRFFDENAPTRLYTASLDLWFVDHPEPYSMVHNSNRVVGQWLVELGCRLEGPALFSIWRHGLAD